MDYPKPKSEAGDGFDVLFEDPALYDIIPYSWRDLFFFRFKQAAPADQVFIYEMTYDTNENTGMPTVYIRAKKSGTGSQPLAVNSFYHAFDMNNFLWNLSPDSKNMVSFNIVFKTGVDKDGKDIYQSWAYNPMKYPLRDE